MRCLIFAITIILSACSGTFTVVGDKTFQDEMQIGNGRERTTLGCESICNQNNPNGKCAERLEQGSKKCTDQLKQ